MLRPTHLFILLCLSPICQAAEVRVLDIQTANDHFTLTLNPSGDSATINGKSANLAAFKNFLPLLTQPLEDPCPQFSEAADVKVRESNRLREIFFARQILREGEGCLQVTGDGLNYFPIHRDFLIGSNEGSVALVSPLSFKIGGKTLFQLSGKSPTWRLENSDYLLNWDFFERFEKSLQSYSIRLRARMTVVMNEPQLVFETSGKVFSFYKLGTATWGLKRPDQNWLEITDDFSFFYDLDGKVTEDRLAPAIRILGDSKVDLKLRRQQFDKLKSAWSPNLRDVYFKLLLDPSENAEFKSLVMRRLRGHPTRETAWTMAKFLPNASVENKTLATQVLKLVEPKGPVFNPEDSPSTQQKTLKYWASWLSKEKTSP